MKQPTLQIAITACLTLTPLSEGYTMFYRHEFGSELPHLEQTADKQKPAELTPNCTKQSKKKKTTEQPSNQTKSNPTHQNQGAYAQPEYYFSSHFRVLVTIIAQHLHCIFWTSTKGIAQTCLTYFSSVTRCYALLPSPAG